MDRIAACTTTTTTTDIPVAGRITAVVLWCVVIAASAVGKVIAKHHRRH